MSNKIHTNLYNKYRPNNFNQVIGQDHVTKIIEQQIKDNSLPHTLILYGPYGTGKTSCARLIAKALNPSNYGLIEKDSSVDGGKGDIVDLQTDIYNQPFVGNYKTYIFDEAHEITKKAFSSLLKITEEPPSHVKFIFVTTDFEKIPLTIKSRSQCHCFVRLKNNIIRQHVLDIIKLEKQNIPESIVNLIVESGNGSLRNAIVALETIISIYKSGNNVTNISDILGILGTTRIVSFINAYLNKDFKTLNDLVPMFYGENTDTLKALHTLQQFVVDSRICLILPKMQDEVRSNVESLVSKFNESFKDKSKEDIISERKRLGILLDLLYDLLLDLEVDLKKTSNKEAIFTRFIIKLAKTW